MKGFLKKEVFLHFEVISRLRQWREMSEIIRKKNTDTEKIPDFFFFFFFAKMYFLVSREMLNEGYSHDRSEDGVTHPVTALPGAHHYKCPVFVFLKLNPEEWLQGSQYTEPNRQP